MRRAITPLVNVGNIRLPPELAEEVNRLLHDPRTSRKRYGSLTQLMVILLTNWVEEHRASPARAETSSPALTPASRAGAETLEPL